MGLTSASIFKDASRLQVALRLWQLAIDPVFQRIKNPNALYRELWHLLRFLLPEPALVSRAEEGSGNQQPGQPNGELTKKLIYIQLFKISYLYNKI